VSAPWEIVVGAVFLLPSMAVAILRYLTFRYRYGERDLIIRSGLLFRNERHIPYARIQNLDGVQNVLHRLAGVAEVRVDTGGGAKAEATLRVLPLSDLEEMRRRVFAPAAADPAPAAAPGAASAPAPATVLLALRTRELLVSGLIHARGTVLAAAGLGLLWQVDVFERVSDAFWSQGASLARRATLFLPALLIVILLLRLAGMVWAAVRLHGFRLSRHGDDLRTEYGLLTRVHATVPRRRIQTLSVREAPLARLLRRVAVRVETAGGGAGDATDWDGTGDRDQSSARQRAWIAPVLRRARLAEFLGAVLPDLGPAADLDRVAWQPVAPGAFRRRLKRPLLILAATAVPLGLLLRWWALLPILSALVWLVLWARLSVRRLGWSLDGGTFLLRSGWLWRRTTLVRCPKIQSVSVRDSPFDRRAGMATIGVDTAGQGALDAIEVPYLERAVAAALYSRLVTAAATSTFRW
jgi:putative membrane protein